MTFDGLRAGLRAMFWCLVYLGTICGALLAFAPSPYRWAVMLDVATVCVHDAYRRLTPERIRA